MSSRDSYSDIAEHYDYMLAENREREAFFRIIMDGNKVSKVLDCACGTGRDLILFKSFGYEVTGSDLSDSMLQVAHKKIAGQGLKIPLWSADFQQLADTFRNKFDAVVCLGNSINEAGVNVLKALNSMKSVLQDNGIIIFDQGQTDFTMQNPPDYSLEVNDRDFSRLFTMDYDQDIMTVHVFDLVHKERERDFRHSKFEIRIRLIDDWQKILREANLAGEFFGDWNFGRYDKRNSKRLIIMARKRN